LKKTLIFDSGSNSQRSTAAIAQRITGNLTNTTTKNILAQLKNQPSLAVT
jgi:hypothetical protein